MRLTTYALRAGVAAILTVTVTLAASTAAWAHDQAKGPNGGVVVDDAGHHIEFTAKPDQIVLYLHDASDKPLSSAKATGRIISLAGTKQSTLELAAVEPNLIVAKLDAPLAPATKLVVSIKLEDGHNVTARFVAP
jgi:hypothetical protein